MTYNENDIVVVGASGHAKVIIEIVRAQNRYNIIGLVDARVTGEVLGAPVLGTDDILVELQRMGVKRAFIAIGDNAIRKRVTTHVCNLGFIVPAVVSPRASVSPSAKLGDGVAIMGGVTINAHAVIGAGTIVNTNASIDHDCIIHSFVHCAPGTHLAGCVNVDEGAFLGIGTVALPGVRVGEWATAGAGAVITEDIPPGVIAVGTPARQRVREER